MRRLLVGVLALAATGCGTSAQVALGARTPKGVDQGVVEQLVCLGEIEKAEVYAGDRGASRAEITEAITRAQRAVARKGDCK